MASRMYAAQQLLRALESLHKAGIVHRDLNENNCMWGLPSLRGLNRTAKYQKLGRPLRQTIPFPESWKLGEMPESWKGLWNYPGYQDSWYGQCEGINPVENGELKARIARRRPDVDQEE
ncbi:protein kinase domain protein [Penicillium malachiteum]|uniref:Protein kinase domain protein n=1 Tax=Penicillium malachiteum TaxID=1324776 RepID=A0AAD6HXK1_9EURO|nr:protein kinase domain protein [Penicillium malachiteum]